MTVRCVTCCISLGFVVIIVWPYMLLVVLPEVLLVDILLWKPCIVLETIEEQVTDK